MKYFQLFTSSDPKVIGVKTGIGQAKFDRNSFDDPNLYDKVMNFFSMKNYHSSNDHTPAFEIHFSSIWLDKQGKLTDFMSVSPYLIACYFLISHKVTEIFSKFQLAEHYLFPATVVDTKGNKYEYKVLYMPMLDYSIIDFHQSEFITENPVLDTIKEHTFESEEEFVSSLKKNMFLKAKKLKLNEMFDKETDVMSIRGQGIYGSEELVNELKKNDCTGIVYKSPPFSPLIEV